MLTQSYSWTIENKNCAFKILDKSAFLHKGTGVPIEIRPFFIDGEMEKGERTQLVLRYNHLSFDAHIDFENQDTARTRLFWDSHFSSLLRKNFPHHHKQYSNNEKPESAIVLKFQKLAGADKYDVFFATEVSDNIVNNDIVADELEDRGSQKEGKGIEYYGKRYERSPHNRKQAIRIHGLSCNACGFNFQKTYGERGVDYIEVHHVMPIHTYEKEQTVNPYTDLVTVCSNCHRMMHRKPSNILTVDEIKRLFQKKSPDL